MEFVDPSSVRPLVDWKMDHATVMLAGDEAK